MKKLTKKEEEILNYFWTYGPMFIRELLERQPQEPKPHYNTIATLIRVLEEKGYIGYKAYGGSHQYYALITKEDYRDKNLSEVVDKYYDKSYLRVVSSMIEEEKLSLDELQKLITQIRLKGRQQ